MSDILTVAAITALVAIGVRAALVGIMRSPRTADRPPRRFYGDDEN